MKPLFCLLLLLVASVVHAEWGLDTKLSFGETSVGLSENMGPCLVAQGTTLHVVWSDTQRGSGIYYSRSTDEGITWAAPVRLSPTPGADVYPYLACVGNYVHLVFIRNNDTPRAASYYKRSTDGGLTWGPDVLLGATKFWPGVAAVGANVYVSMETRLPSGISQVYFLRSTDNGDTWSAQRQVSNGINRSEDPAIAAAGDNVYLLWNDNRSGTMEAEYRRSTDHGATWGPETALTLPPVNEYTPTILATGADVAYADRQSGKFQIFYQHSADGGATWGATQQLSASTTMAIFPQLARHGQDVYITWPGQLFFRHSADGGATWEPVTPLCATDAGFSFVAASTNAVHLIWIDNRLGHKALFYKRNPPAKGAGAR